MTRYAAIQQRLANPCCQWHCAPLFSRNHACVPGIGMGAVAAIVLAAVAATLIWRQKRHRKVNGRPIILRHVEAMCVDCFAASKERFLPTVSPARRIKIPCSHLCFLIDAIPRAELLESNTCTGMCMLKSMCLFSPSQMKA